MKGALRPVFSRSGSLRAMISWGGSLVLLVAMIVAGTRRPAGVQNRAYLERVASAMSAIPYRIGEWVGADMTPQAPAIELLRPNKLVQRRYTTLDGHDAFTILFVHCLDARDMQGHYPPVCYPAHGWVVESSRKVTFPLGYETVPAMVYEMAQLRHDELQHMTILNFFVVPSDRVPLAADMQAVNRAAAASARAWQGAAQVQIIVDGEGKSEELTTLAGKVAQAIEPAIHSVMRGAEDYAR